MTRAVAADNIVITRIRTRAYARTAVTKPLTRLIFVVLGLAAGLAEASPKRARPDYDGRGNPDAKAGSWLLWIPRVVLAPLYVVNEYVVRRPIGAVVKRAERGRWVNDVAELFHFGKGGKSVTAPTVLFDLGLLPRVGMYFSSLDRFADGNAIDVHAAAWGLRSINVAVRDRYTFAHGTSLAVRGDFQRERDRLYFGTGPDVTDATRARYGIQRFDGSLVLRQPLAVEGHLALVAGVRRTAYRRGDCCGDPSLDARIDAGELAPPPGYGPASTALYQRLELRLDTRRPRPAPGSGVFAEMRAETSFDAAHDRGWLALGGTAGVAIDLNRRHRTLEVQLGVDQVDPLRGETVPFEELAAPSLMPGFLPGWMLGRSAIAAQVGYSWPIYGGLDAQTHLSVGNAFAAHLHGLAPRKLRLSWDLGVATTGKRDQGFELRFGLGTETFEQGADITSVRLSFGSRRGF